MIAISVHVRRTDYVNSGRFNLTQGYYTRAMEYIAKIVENPHFYIFSDDINWVEKNMEFNYPHTFVKGNMEQDSYIDMWLMSQCKHNIIANSTFSWWGAWLNNNPEKIVIAPNVWGKESQSLEKTKQRLNEIIPVGWILIANEPSTKDN